ncbi:amyloid beta precursor like protein 2-like isoform X2 [Panonychus citri]|uniref:amyloid beta precursor like protein 2-like isoform X2 n=1 Tax=Panonychus citri TaxID=50023 RepID=UPI00230761A8|nr:amyloid beta precursor like protein 2-like isoform X2 [Panonychus citri]
MKLKSFGMLLPCGVGIFGGVEFVCCPAWSTTTSPPELVTLGTEKKQLENQITYKDAEDNEKTRINVIGGSSHFVSIRTAT